MLLSEYSFTDSHFYGCLIHTHTEQHEIASSGNFITVQFVSCACAIESQMTQHKIYLSDSSTMTPFLKKHYAECINRSYLLLTVLSNSPSNRKESHVRVTQRNPARPAILTSWHPIRALGPPRHDYGRSSPTATSAALGS
jgi:hypothetical protein